MELILNNPYRILGLLAGASAREQTKQINRLKMYIESDQDIKDDFSFPILGKLHRTTEIVESSVSKLNLDKDKISAALFWFWNGNPITDEAAFEALKSGDIETAYGIWEKLIIKTDENGKRYWKSVSEKNYSAFHNYSIINLIRPNGNLHNAVVSSLFFLESDLIQKFISTVADETHNVNKKDLQILFLNQLFSEISEYKKELLPKFFEILNKKEFSAKQEFRKFLAQKTIQQIEHKIETAKNKRKSNKLGAAIAGQELYITTANDLTQLKSIIGEDDIKYTSIADKLANEILQCSIDYFNESQKHDNDSDCLETAMELAKKAENIAVGKLTKDRVKENIEILEELKDRELIEAIAVLQHIKDAYEEVNRNIELHVNELKFLLGDASMNFKELEELKKNLIDWNKVTNAIHKAIPPENIEKIKQSKNTKKVNEYKELVDFVFSKISASYKHRITYINYWDTPKVIYPSSNSSQTSKATNTSTPSSQTSKATNTSTPSSQTSKATNTSTPSSQTSNTTISSNNASKSDTYQSLQKSPKEKEEKEIRSCLLWILKVVLIITTGIVGAFIGAFLGSFIGTISSIFGLLVGFYIGIYLIGGYLVSLLDKSLKEK